MSPEDPNFPHEEYELLLGSTAPGTARNLHRRSTASKSSLDVALADLSCDARPSGVVLPKILRRKLRLSNRIKENATNSSGAADGEMSMSAQKELEHTLRILDDMARVPLLDRVAHYDAKRLHSKSPIAQIHSNYEQVIENDIDDVRNHIPKYYETPSSYRNLDRSRIFTTTELEKNLSKAHAALVDIQKQLYRGEEIYFHDTDMHGNMYKGWEAFIDSKPEHIGIQDVDTVPMDEASLLGPTTAASAPSRKMQPDLRWFSSSSCAVDNGSIRKYDRQKKGKHKKRPLTSPMRASPILPDRLSSPSTRRSPTTSTLMPPPAPVSVPVPGAELAKNQMLPPKPSKSPVLTSSQGSAVSVTPAAAPPKSSTNISHLRIPRKKNSSPKKDSTKVKSLETKVTKKQAVPKLDAVGDIQQGSGLKKDLRATEKENSGEMDSTPLVKSKSGTENGSTIPLSKNKDESIGDKPKGTTSTLPTDEIIENNSGKDVKVTSNATPQEASNKSKETIVDPGTKPSSNESGLSKNDKGAEPNEIGVATSSDNPSLSQKSEDINADQEKRVSPILDTSNASKKNNSPSANIVESKEKLNETSQTEDAAKSKDIKDDGKPGVKSKGEGSPEEDGKEQNTPIKRQKRNRDEVEESATSGDDDLTDTEARSPRMIRSRKRRK